MGAGEFARPPLRLGLFLLLILLYRHPVKRFEPHEEYAYASQQYSNMLQDFHFMLLFDMSLRIAQIERCRDGRVVYVMQPELNSQVQQFQPNPRSGPDLGLGRMRSVSFHETCYIMFRRKV